MILHSWALCSETNSSRGNTVSSILTQESGLYQHLGNLPCMFLNTMEGKPDANVYARSNGARAGEVLGLILNGFISERLGFRKTMIGALFAMIAFIFILFFAPNVQTLVVGEIFCGIPWGMFQTLAPQVRKPFTSLGNGYRINLVSSMLQRSHRSSCDHT